jgi:hypothetical protein
MSHQSITRKEFHSSSLLVIASGSIRHAQAATTVIADPGNMNGWAFAQENQATGSGSLVTGPRLSRWASAAPISTVDGTGQEILFTTTFTGTRSAALPACNTAPTAVLLTQGTAWRSARCSMSTTIFAG